MSGEADRARLQREAAARPWSGDHKADCLNRLLTVRDWLRFAVSRFNEAGLCYGHGTETALDEAVFLTLSVLRLRIDDLDPWLDARLTRGEAANLYDVLRARVQLRKPAPYLIGCAYIQGVRFTVDERVIVPRSFIGELLADGLQPVVADPDDLRRVLDLCTGAAPLAILAAFAFENATVDATDLSRDALNVARINVSDHGLDDRVSLYEGDLFEPLPGDARYDLILANPPYVRTGAVQTFPGEYAAEPAMAHDGGDDGLDLVHSILRDAPRFLTPDGHLVVEVGQEREAVEAAYPDLPFLWLDTERSEGEVFALKAEDLRGIKQAEA